MLVPPAFEKNLKDCTLVVGQGVSFEAIVIGEPAPTVKWLKENKEIAPGDGITFKHSDREWSMAISEASKEDKGVYTAVAKNSVGEEKSSARLEIQGEAVVKTVFLQLVL